MFRLNKGFFAMGIPLALSTVAVIRHSIAFFVIYILAHFLVLKITPAFKRRENIGMFVIVAISSIPINIYLFRMLSSMELIFDSFLVVNILRGILYYIVLLSIEEIVMGILTRMIWKKQYKIVL